MAEQHELTVAALNEEKMRRLTGVSAGASAVGARYGSVADLAVDSANSNTLTLTPTLNLTLTLTRT